MKNKGMPKGSVKIKRIMRRYRKQDAGPGDNLSLKKPGKKLVSPGTPESSDTTGSIHFNYTVIPTLRSGNLSEKSTRSE